MVVCTINTANGKRAWTPWALSLALALSGGGVSLISTAPGALAQSGNAAALASLRVQIQRYGCNLPKYANSVAGCQKLHARVKALKSGASDPGRVRQPASSPYRYNTSAYSSRRAPRPVPAPSSSGGGFFSSLFGGGGSTRSRSASRNTSYSLPYQGLSGWWGGAPSAMRGAGRYRTLCVRTCDGYYWPMSFSATRSGIARDANQCVSSCQAPAKLFYHRNPGADIQNMVDLKGMPYSRTENAFRYRKEYVKNCRCKPEPWSEAAKQVYEQRAEQAENPQPVKTAANATNRNGVPIKTSNGTAYPGGFYPKPAPRRRSRPRYRADDPALSGRWWAGSW